MNTGRLTEAQYIHAMSNGDEINEAKSTFPAADIKKIAQMTDRNDHTGNLIFLATKLKHKRYLKIFQGVQDIQDAIGHLPKDLYNLRYHYAKKLWAFAEIKLTNWTEVKGAF